MKIYIIGYPFSGNSWITRLLGDVLDCAVTGGKNYESMARRKGNNTKHVIVHTNVMPRRHGPLLTKNFLNMILAEGDLIICPMRDPRDVAVSMHHYIQSNDMMRTLTVMRNGLGPVKCGPWMDYMMSWLVLGERVHFPRYENFSNNPVSSLRKLLSDMSIDYDYGMNLVNVAERNSFLGTRRRMMEAGRGVPFGISEQLRLLRQGYVGSWRMEMTHPRVKKYADSFMGPFLYEQGYETSSKWVTKQFTMESKP